MLNIRTTNKQQRWISGKIVTRALRSTFDRKFCRNFNKADLIKYITTTRNAYKELLREGKCNDAIVEEDITGIGSRTYQVT